MSYFKSEMGRAFAKTAKAKGWVKEEPKIVRTASIDKVAEPTDNVMVDICRLVEALRSKGFEKQASDIEESFLEYKQAEVHLYNVHDEDGPDFLQAAHPEGDQKIEDAADGLGVVETDISAHKKIMDVVNKEPKGSLAAAAEFLLRKNANPFEEQKASWQQVAGGRNKCLTALGQPTSYVFTIESLYSGYSTGGNAYTAYFEKLSGDSTVANAYRAYTNYIYLLGDNPTDQSVAESIKSAMSTVDFEMDPTSKDADWYKEIVNFVNRLENKKWEPMASRLWPSGFITSSFYGHSKDGPGYTQLGRAIVGRVNELKQIINNSINVANNEVQKSVYNVVTGLSSIELSPKNEDIKEEFYKFTSDQSIVQITELLTAFSRNASQYSTGAYEINTGLASVEIERADAETKAKGLAQVTSTRFSKASKLFDDYAADHPEASGYDENAERSARISQIVSSYYNDFNKLASELKRITGLDFKNFSDVDKFSIQWLTEARKMAPPKGSEANPIDADEWFEEGEEV